MSLRLILPLILLLAACADEPVPTEAENAHLDEAGNMLDNLAEEPARR